MSHPSDPLARSPKRFIQDVRDTLYHVVRVQEADAREYMDDSMDLVIMMWGRAVRDRGKWTKIVDECTYIIMSRVLDQKLAHAAKENS